MGHDIPIRYEIVEATLLGHEAYKGMLTKLSRNAPVYGYGKFVHPRPWYRDPNVSIAGERLIWAQVEELCKSSGLIWREEWTGRYFDWRAYRRADDKAKHAEGWRKRFMKPEQGSDWHGRSILNPDEAFRNETYIDTNPILRTTGAADEKEKEQRLKKHVVVEALKKFPIQYLPQSADVPLEVLMEIAEGKRTYEDTLKEYPMANHQMLRKRVERLSHMVAVAFGPERLWKQASAPGVYALTHFSHRPWTLHKISEAVEVDEIVADFRNIIADACQQRIDKGQTHDDKKGFDDMLEIADEFLRVGWRVLPDNPELAEQARGAAAMAILVLASESGLYDF